MVLDEEPPLTVVMVAGDAFRANDGELPGRVETIGVSYTVSDVDTEPAR